MPWRRASAGERVGCWAPIVGGCAARSLAMAVNATGAATAAARLRAARVLVERFRAGRSRAGESVAGCARCAGRAGAAGRGTKDVMSFMGVFCPSLLLLENTAFLLYLRAGGEPSRPAIDSRYQR